jgi:phage baseplate assembly protein W
MTTKHVWADIGNNFKRNPVTNDLAIEVDDVAIGNSIINLVETMFSERLFQPELGSSIAGSLFQNFNPTTEYAAQRSIEEVISNNEPRAILRNISLESDQQGHALTITIVYSTIKNQSITNTVSTVI